MDRPRETFPIRLPGGQRLYGQVFNTPRPGGRRITVLDLDGVKLFDTGDQYDLGNARAALDEWLTGRVAEGPTGPPTEVVSVVALRDAG